MRDQVDPADPKWLLVGGFVNDLMSPREEDKIVGFKRDPLPVDAHPPVSADDPQQHPAFDASVDDAFTRTKLKPVGEDDHRIGVCWLSDRNIYVTTGQAMVSALYKIYRISMTSQSAIATPSADFVDSMPLLENPAALRTRALEDGYLFFRGLLPIADVLALRAELLAVVERHGWRTPDQDEFGDLIEKTVIDNIGDTEMQLGIGVSTAAYNEVQRLELFHRLPHHPKLLELFGVLFGRAAFVHPRHIARMVTPHRSMVPTPIHQDFPLIQGSQNTWTCWFPLGDCPRELGGLSILRGSHHNGYLPVQVTDGAGGLEAQLCAGESDWLETDYRCGDVLIFPCFTVHRALRATLTNRIRLSLDVRYQPDNEPIEARSLLPHCDLSWDEIYAGWTSRELQYYWKSLNLEPSPWNELLFQPGTRIC